MNSKLEQSNIVRSIVPFGNELLVGTYNGIFIFNPEKGTYRLLSDQLQKKVSYTVDLKVQGNNLWIGSTGLWRYNIKTGELKSYNQHTDDTLSYTM